MKILVVFYSLHNNTQLVANRIAKIIGADVEEIVDLKDRKHLDNWHEGAFDEELRSKTEIAEAKHNPKHYDLVIIGTPIWDGVTPAVRAYLSKYKLKKVAYFATFGASAEDAFYQMEKISGRKPIATLEVQDRQIVYKEHIPLIQDFCNKIKIATS